ncbi:MAG: PP2C family protein-serine/threonine phosphatase [Phycisphaerales bacterium]
MSNESSQAQHTMQCMEVWGGNAASDNGVVMPGLDAWVFSRPHAGDASGGDVHYVSSCATGRITRLLVADVSGHGQGVADVAVSLRNLMRRFINFVDQARLVRSLNKEFSELSQAGRFATAVVATYWSPTNYLVICNAGHPAPFLYRAKSATWEILRPSASARTADDTAAPESAAPGTEPAIVNLPLGIDDLAGYDNFGVELAPGDLVLFYTDSLIELSDARTGRLLGEDGLLAVLTTLDAGDPASLVPRIIDRLRVVSGADPDDDLTLLLLRHNGSQIAAPVWQGLIAPLRIARDAVRRLLRNERDGIGRPEISVPAIGGAVVPTLSKSWGPKRKK